MKTRDEIYNTGEASALLRILTTYHALYYEQVLQTFAHRQESVRTMIAKLIKQGRIFYDKERDLLCDRSDAASQLDPGLLAAYWVLLDFKKAIVYHTSGEFPVKIHFFSQDEVYEIIYIVPGQEVLMNHVLAREPDDVNRLVIVETTEQALQLEIPNVVAFCTVNPDGTVSYYAKGK